MTKLELELKMRNMTSKDLSDETGLSRVTISNIITGKTKTLSWDTAEKLSKKFDVEESYFHKNPIKESPENEAAVSLLCFLTGSKNKWDFANKIDIKYEEIERISFGFKPLPEEIEDAAVEYAKRDQSQDDKDDKIFQIIDKLESSVSGIEAIDNYFDGYEKHRDEAYLQQRGKDTPPILKALYEVGIFIYFGTREGKDISVIYDANQDKLYEISRRQFDYLIREFENVLPFLFGHFVSRARMKRSLED